MTLIQMLSNETTTLANYVWNKNRPSMVSSTTDGCIPVQPRLKLNCLQVVVCSRAFNTDLLWDYHEVM